MMRVNASVNSSPFVVIALADGMGGMSDGSECAVRSLAAFFNSIVRLRNYDPKEMLRLASLEANMAVFEFSKGRGGATLSAILISNGGVSTSLNIGDSRIYGRQKASLVQDVVRLTVDDNLEEAVGGTGKELLQFSGMGAGLNPHVAIVPSDIDRIVITSDGVHFINKEVFNEIVLNTERIGDLSKSLLTYARWRGSPDNASLAIIDVKNAFSTLKYEVSGIEFISPFSVLELAWLRQGAPEISMPASPLPIEIALQKNPATDKKRMRKPKIQNSSKKKEIDNNLEGQLSIKIDSTPINEDPIIENKK